MKEYPVTPADMPESFETKSLADILRWRAYHQGDRLALTYLPDGETEAACLTYRQMDMLARRTAAELQKHNARGRAVILLFQPGPEFLIGFLSCLYAGAKGVPLYPPDLKRINRTLPRFLAIVEDCESDIILTTRQMKTLGTAVFEHAPQLAARAWLTVDGLPEGLENEWSDPGVSTDEVAFLQYTSGSTGDPKGIEVTHRSLLLNFMLMTKEWNHAPGETTVTWLPNYHDMGLIDGWLRPIYVGCHCIGMPPLAFLKNPFCWLKAISKYRGVISGGPNFSYELCITKITDEELKELDLSCWKVAYNGAEPVRPETARRFTERFAACGLPPTAFSPGYGLAEAALFVCASSRGEPAVFYPISKTDLENRIITPVEMGDPDCFVAVGVGKAAIPLLIVDPDSCLPLGTNKVGEIWLFGPSLASGYWKRPEQTREVFQAVLGDSGEGPYVRTGDLAFVREDGELFIAGRIKDLIIIAGRNIYPQDVEQTVENTDTANLRPGCNAAFSVDVGGEERLVVVQEVQRRHKKQNSEWADRRLPNPEVEAFAPVLDNQPDFDKTLAKIRASINIMHNADPYAIILIKAGTIPKTSSGKIQRRACRENFLKEGLDIIKSWRADAPGQSEDEVLPAEPVKADRRVKSRTPDSERGAAIRRWLRHEISQRFSIPLSRLSDQQPFIELGLDSRHGIIMVGDLERWLKEKLPASIFYDYPSIDRVVRHLDGQPDDEFIDTTAAAPDEPIAIIGIGCRFPGANGPEAFWKLLSEGIEAISEVPASRWSLEKYYDPDPGAPGKMISRHGGFVDGIDLFDPEAFGITHREAARMDPQQRLLLETTSEAFENAGITPEILKNLPCGVFVGISSFDYSRHLFQNREGIDAYYGTGSALSIAANRISYHFDLHGPSLAVDSACSSSLVAVHLAMESLRRGECTLAVAGGVNALLLPDINITFTKAGVLSTDGRCKTFDAAADGIARAEGAGAVILKPLSRAIADKDRIWAVLLGSAVNSDGRSNGLMAPNGTAQQRVVASAYRNAGISPAAVQYIEAHGTGTDLGDPIEVGALANIISKDRPVDLPCRIGSVKTNFGHLEAGAGIAGLIKVALMLHEKKLVPSLNFETPNPKIPFEEYKIQVQTCFEPWPAHEGQALAGVSAFGFGGTNAHVVLRDHTNNAAAADHVADMPTLVPLSARSDAGLRILAEAVRNFADEENERLNIVDLAQSASLKRAHLPVRLAVVARSLPELRNRLDSYLDGKSHPMVVRADVLAVEQPRVAFICPGQGGQWFAMGRELLAYEPVFRHALERYDALFMPLSGWSLIEELHKDEVCSRVNDIEFSQPLLFALQAGLWELWRSLGIEPGAVVGHSMGEITAAYIAGKLTLEEAIRLIYHRGRLMGQVRGQGGMASLEVGFGEAEQLISGYPGKLSVAVNNAPSSCVIAGARAALTEIMEKLAQKDVFCREVHVQVAGHSPDMELIKAELAALSGDIPNRPPVIPIISTVIGGPGDDLAFDGSYWSRNLREPVRFQSAMETLLDQGFKVFLELGPHPTLINAVVQTAAHAGLEPTTLYSLRRGTGERETILAAAGALHTLGFEINFARLYPRSCDFIPLPPTPFDRKRCWVDVSDSVPVERAVPGSLHPLIVNHIASPADPGLHLFQADFDLGSLPWVSDHRVQDLAVFPATGYIELIQEACFEAFGEGRYPLREIRFHRALIFGEISARRVQTVLKLKKDGQVQFQVYSKAAAGGEHDSILHATGQVLLNPDSQADSEKCVIDLIAIRARCHNTIGANEHYQAYLDRSIDYRGPFHTVRDVSRRDGEALGTIIFSPDEDRRFHVHPGLLDACLQVMGDALPWGEEQGAGTYMPIGIKRLEFYGKPGLEVRSHVRVKTRGKSKLDRYTADLELTDAEGMVWGRVFGLTVQDINATDAMQSRIQDWLYEVDWEKTGSGKALRLAASGKKGQQWLLFADRSGLAVQLEAELARAGIDVVKAFTGKSFRENKSGFQLNPLNPDHLERLLDECGSPSLSRIVYLWGLDAPAAGETITAGQLLESQEAICSGMIYLMQALEKRNWKQPPLAWIVTKNAEPVKISDVLPEIAQTALWGLGRSLAHEFSRFWGGLIDVDDYSETALLAGEIAQTGDDDQIALRGSDRFVPRLVHRPVSLSDKKMSLRKDSSYLITGGLGSLGLRLALWLAGNGAGRLILTSRRGFAPPRRDWPKLAAKGNKQAEALLAIESLGAKVCTPAADVCDPEAMKKVFAIKGFTPVAGVIHAAGIVAPKPAMALTGADLKAELGPKVEGTWILHELTRKLKLDFFVLFSSASAIWGSKLLVSYGAANHFMDGLARYRRKLGLTALTVNWAMWGGGGMGVENEQNNFLQRTGLRPMAPEQALLILKELIKTDAIQKTVANNDWALLKSLFELEPRRRLLKRITVQGIQAEAAGDSGPAACSELMKKLQSSSDENDRRSLVREFVLAQTADVLGIPVEALEPDKSLLAQKLDSLTANDLRARLQNALPIQINVLSLLKGDSPKRISEQVYEQVQAALLTPADLPQVAGGPVTGPEFEVLPDDIQPGSAEPPREGDARAVLLTGATGFLGVYVLSDLYRRTSAQIHCLVRADNDREAMARLKEKLREALLWEPGMAKRIVPVAGDLAQPKLGLSPGKWQALAHDIDQIYHVGYVVNFLFSYEDLRTANVLSLIDLLRLASTERVKPVHFVSSFSVLLTKEYAGVPVGESDPLYPGEGGYREGKRAGELLVAEARRRGLPVSIYRPPFIGWHSRSGYYNDRDFLIKLIRGCLMLGSAPDLDVLFYIAPVDFVSGSIVELAVKSGEYRNYNILSSPIGIAWADLVELIRRAGGRLKMEPFAAWRECLDQAGPDNPLHIFFPLMGENIQEKGSAVMELFHRSAAPSRIELSGLRDKLGEPDAFTEVNAELIAPFVKRVLNNNEQRL